MFLRAQHAGLALDTARIRKALYAKDAGQGILYRRESLCFFQLCRDKCS